MSGVHSALATIFNEVIGLEAKSIKIQLWEMDYKKSKE
jgi:hypothetical protein